MMVPLWILGLGTVVLGIFQIPGATTGMTSWLEPSMAGEILEPTAGEDWAITAIAVALGIAGIAVAAALWGGHAEDVARLRAGAGRPFALLFERKFFVDELYDVLFYTPAAAIARFLRRFVERPLFQLPLDGIGLAGRAVARQLGLLESGIVRLYALAIALGAGGLAIWFLTQAA